VRAALLLRLWPSFLSGLEPASLLHVRSRPAPQRPSIHLYGHRGANLASRQPLPDRNWMNRYELRCLPCGVRSHYTTTCSITLDACQEESSKRLAFERQPSAESGRTNKPLAGSVSDSLLNAACGSQSGAATARARMGRHRIRKPTALCHPCACGVRPFHLKRKRAAGKQRSERHHPIRAASLRAASPRTWHGCPSFMARELGLPTGFGFVFERGRADGRIERGFPSGRCVCASTPVYPSEHLLTLSWAKAILCEASDMLSKTLPPSFFRRSLNSLRQT
jgi:hypothetical protein